MDMINVPDRSWIVSHQRVAQAAQLGTMGLHRNLIHPHFGSFVLLGTVPIDDRELEVQPGVLAGRSIQPPHPHLLTSNPLPCRPRRWPPPAHAASKRSWTATDRGPS